MSGKRKECETNDTSSSNNIANNDNNDDEQTAPSVDLVSHQPNTNTTDDDVVMDDEVANNANHNNTASNTVNGDNHEVPAPAVPAAAAAMPNRTTISTSTREEEEEEPLSAPPPPPPTTEQEAQSGYDDNASAALDQLPRSKRLKRTAARAAAATWRTSSSDKNESSMETKDDTSSEKKKKKKINHDDVDDTEKEFDTCWICCECKEAECMIKSDADELMICEGVCRRLFHYPCAGLAQAPAKDESYICPDCTNGSHACAHCQEYGVDNEQVFLCSSSSSSKQDCGLFFHESCLEDLRVPVKLVETQQQQPQQATTTTTTTTAAAEVSSSSTTHVVVRREFTCPAHSCWTCTQPDEAAFMQAGGNYNAGNGGTTDASATTMPPPPPPKKGKGGKKKKKRGGKKTVHHAFQQKRLPLLIRCLECPIAYHVCCIPPVAKFHELALLCHEHAPSRKLPELDPEYSIEGSIDVKIGEKFAAYMRKQEQVGAAAAARRRRQANESTAFFLGLKGDQLTRGESQWKERLVKENFFMSSGAAGSFQQNTTTWFCLPCDIKDAVHSKPPSYHHIHALQYSPGRRPPRIPIGDMCECSGTRCGEDCLNRLLYVECVGEKGDGNNNNKNKKSNCNVGSGCGNRPLSQRKVAKCQTKREHGRGWGLVTTEKVKKGALVQEYIGEVVDAKTKEERLAEWEKEHPNDPNFYLMSLSGEQWFIDARLKANQSRFINHSCSPNCDLTPINVKGYIRNGIFARRDIEAGEFLSYDYKFDTRHGDRFVCRCGASNCRGTMKGGVKAMGGEETRKTKKEVWEQAKKEYDKDKAFLADLDKKEQERLSCVGAMVPSAENTDELVSNGASTRHREEARDGRIFLWRNARLGSDLASRLTRLGKQPQSK